MCGIESVLLILIGLSNLRIRDEQYKLWTASFVNCLPLLQILSFRSEVRLIILLSNRINVSFCRKLYKATEEMLIVIFRVLGTGREVSDQDSGKHS
jgi:hypothetical protein